MAWWFSSQFCNPWSLALHPQKRLNCLRPITETTGMRWAVRFNSRPSRKAAHSSCTQKNCHTNIKAPCKNSHARGLHSASWFSRHWPWRLVLTLQPPPQPLWHQPQPWWSALRPMCCPTRGPTSQKVREPAKRVSHHPIAQIPPTAVGMPKRDKFCVCPKRNRLHLWAGPTASFLERWCLNRIHNPEYRAQNQRPSGSGEPRISNKAGTAWAARPIASHRPDFSEVSRPPA